MTMVDKTEQLILDIPGVEPDTLTDRQTDRQTDRPTADA